MQTLCGMLTFEFILQMARVLALTLIFLLGVVVLGVSGDHVGDCSSTCPYCAISCRLRGYRFGECLAIGFCPPSAPYRCVCRVVSVSDVIHQNIHHSSNASVWSQLHIRILLHKLLLLMSFAYWILIFWNSYHCWWPR